MYHIVKQGESLWIISKMYNVGLEDLLAVNPQLQNPNAISIGEAIYLPEYNSDCGCFDTSQTPTPDLSLTPLYPVAPLPTPPSGSQIPTPDLSITPNRPVAPLPTPPSGSQIPTPDLSLTPQDYFLGTRPRTIEDVPETPENTWQATPLEPTLCEKLRKLARPLIYQVKSGDTLDNIATCFEISIAELMETNPEIRDANLIYAGQKLYIPKPRKPWYM